MRKIIISLTGIALVIAVTVFVSLFLMSHSVKSKTVQTGKRKAPNVDVLVLKRTNAPFIMQKNGVLRSGRTVELSALLNEKIVSISKNALNGLVIDAGESVLELDARNLLVKKERTGSLLRSLQSDIKKLDQTSKNMDKEIQLQKKIVSLHKKEKTRMERLLKDKHVSPGKVDDAAIQHLRSEEALLKLQNAFSLLPFQREELQETVTRTEAELKEIQLNLEKTTVLAPFRGKVTFEDVQVGQVAQVGKKLITMYDMSLLELPLSVSIKEYLTWFAGHEKKKKENRPFIRITLDNNLSQKTNSRKYVAGALIRIEGVVDSATRTATLVFALQLDKDLSQSLLPGTFFKADIVIPLNEPHFEVNPKYIHGNQLYLMRDNTLAIVDIKTIKQPGNKYIVLSDSLQGEKVVTTPINYPRQGMTLRLKQTSTPLIQ